MTQGNQMACANCGQTIGRLESPRVWGDHYVCGACYARLAGQPSSTGLVSTRVLPPQPRYVEAEIVDYEPTPPSEVDSLDQLAMAARGEVYSPSQYSQPQATSNTTIVNQIYVNPPRQQRGRQSNPILAAGLMLTLISIPLFCVLWPVACLILVIGLVLMVVGACV